MARSYSLSRIFLDLPCDRAPVEAIRPNTVASTRVWQKAEQIVFSRTLTGAPTRIGRVEREFDPEATRKLKRESKHDIFIGGAEPP
jgi:hypothetical protein